jgi:hypothetical protein
MDHVASVNKQFMVVAGLVPLTSLAALLCGPQRVDWNAMDNSWQKFFFLNAEIMDKLILRKDAVKWSVSESRTEPQAINCLVHL